MELLGRTEHFLKKLLDLVDISLDLSIEGQERRVCPRGQVVQIRRLPTEDAVKEVCVKRRAVSVFHVGNYRLHFLTS